MPALDFREARSRLQLAEVLDLLGFEASYRRGDQVRGPCPVHRSRTPASRSWAAHLGKNVWHCFRCGAGGNALDLWVAVTRQPLHRRGDRSVYAARARGALARASTKHRRNTPCRSHDQATPTVPGS